MNYQSFLQMNTIFISIIIESLPFIIIGVLVSGFIQIFVSEEWLTKIMPKNRFLAVIVATIMGFVFLGCECGIVPITRRLLKKGLPLHSGITFMLTGPIINPIVLFSTYIAFGNSWRMVFLRAGLAIVVACIVGLVLSLQFKDNQLRENVKASVIHDHSHDANRSIWGKIADTLRHSIDEFFSVGIFLIIGAILSSAMQTFVKTSTLTSLGNGDYSSSAVMMALSYVLSICSEADAFIGASFQSTFSVGSIIAFLVFGAMFDIKNTLMLFNVFKTKLVASLFVYVTITVFIGSILIEKLT